jgi:hypothetical protein
MTQATTRMVRRLLGDRVTTAPPASPPRLELGPTATREAARGRGRRAGRVHRGHDLRAQCQLLPGAPYVPGMAGVTEPQRTEGGRWKLDECLRYACSFPSCTVANICFVGLRRSLLRAGLADVRGKA